VRGARTTTTNNNNLRNSARLARHDRILPLFCSVGGEASAREGKPRRLLRAHQNSPPLLRGGGGFSSQALSLSLSLSLSSLSLSSQRT
jgi:hypothetical protein